MNLTLTTVAQTHSFAAALVEASPGGGRVALEGELGAGKTELVRGCLRFMGETGPVRSPTYTLVEEYALPGYRVRHLDLYRLSVDDDMHDLGFREQSGDEWCFVEWPDRLQIPFEFDLRIKLQIQGEDRRVTLEASSNKGKIWLNQLSLNLK